MARASVADVQIVDGELVVSPTDLTRFLACRHLTALDRQVATGERPPPPAAGEALEQLFRRGLEHESAYLARLRAQGRRVVEIPPAGPGAAGLRAAEEATVAAMAAGADVVYQGSFFDGGWRGQADFLLRVDDRPGRWPWSYDVADTKLARRLKVPAVLQMAAYAERLAVLQGVEPEHLVVVAGDGAQLSYRFADCAAYARRVRAAMAQFLADPPVTRAVPVEHCGQCRWQSSCRAGWREQDDLSLVAGMRRHHAQVLRDAGVATVAALAGAEPAALPARLGGAAARYVAQARLQVDERTSGRPRSEPLPVQPGRGLALLPEPSPGDVFFDMEGDPFAGERGLEYLFGVVDASGFTGYWATEPHQEKAAFEALVDHLVAAWAADPGMHVYHYAAYEPARLKALSGRYDTRTEEVDRLLRGQRLVDLYAVVKQGVRVGQESYSLKRLEPYYWARGRQQDVVHDALGSVVAFERWLLERDDAVLEEIRAYNEEDCRSTQALRDWLESLRGDVLAAHVAAGGDPADFARPEHDDGAPPAQVAADADETRALRDLLWSRVPADPGARDDAQQATWLLGALLDWHRREALPDWWEWFDRQTRTDAELQADPAALAGLGPAVPAGARKRSALWAMGFPPQETKVTPGVRWADPRTGRAVTVHDVDPGAGRLVVSVGLNRPAPDLTAVVPGRPVPTEHQRARLHDLGRWVAEHGVDSPLPPWRAARDLLLRERPRVGGGALVAPGERASDAVRRLVSGLVTRGVGSRGGVLPVQGPPGTGKTYSAAHTVVDLAAAGRRVGVCAFSHKVVANLLTEVRDVALARGVEVLVLAKVDGPEAVDEAPVPATDDNADVVEALARPVAAGGVHVVAGTPWLFARPELAGAVDVLVVDEAGQLSLANVLAVSHAGPALVLLGDPQQLAQPVRGSHPPGAGASALGHLLDGAATVPPDRGVLLDTTYRMHPDVSGLVSDLSYDGRLHVAPGRERQRLDVPGRLGVGLSGSGLRWLPVEHAGCTASSPQEARVVADVVAALLEGTWTDADGAVAALTAADVLVLAPYNQHVHAVRQALAGVPGAADVLVGTVDRLQGRQAAAVVYTLATSSHLQVPRGQEFLLDLHRFTVAVSRARALAAVVASPALLLSPVADVAALRRVNALSAYVERASTVETPAGPGAGPGPQPVGRMPHSLAGT